MAVLYSPNILSGHHFAILWASVGNTIPGTFWALYHLVTHPEALTAIRAEVHRVLGPLEQGADPDQALAFSQEKIDGLVYMGECLSIWPAADEMDVILYMCVSPLRHGSLHLEVSGSLNNLRAQSCCHGHVASI